MENYIGRIKAPAALGGEWLGERDNGPNSGWMYTVNGVHVGEGMRVQKVGSGDEIIWHYVDDPVLEVSGFNGGGNALYPDGWLSASDGDDPGPTVDRTALTALITEAAALRDGAEIGSAVGQYPQTAYDAFDAAIREAQVIHGNATAKQPQIDAAVNALNDAVAAFKDAVVKEVGGNPGAPGDNTAGKGAVTPAPQPQGSDVSKTPDTKVAKKSAKTVKIKFSANGGRIIVKRDGETTKVKSTTQKLTAGKKFGSLPKATRSGYYRFKGWYTSDKGGKKVTAKTAVYKKARTLYAQWQTKYGKLNDGVYAVSVRAEASGASTAKGYVNRSVKFRVTDKADRPGESNDWYEVSYKDAKGKKVTGYVHAGYIKTYWDDIAG
jgi:uncharacterized repeat protein (TIGR02543 family)